jgi:phosphatidylinositol alpha-1,6-mannosyltransferase
VGDGDELGFLKALAIENKVESHVQFLGELSDEAMRRCYQHCDLFVLPNRQVGQDIEGFGMVLLEAQACGKPVVAGTSGGTAETMDIPNTGLVVDCESPEALAQNIISLLRDDNRLREMGDAARPWTIEHFDWKSLSLRAAKLFSGQMSPDCKEMQKEPHILATASATPISSEHGTF